MATNKDCLLILTQYIKKLPTSADNNADTNILWIQSNYVYYLLKCFLYLFTCESLTEVC